MTYRTADDLLGSYSPEIAELSYTVRDVVHQTLPFAKEKVISGWRILAYSKHNIFLYIAPSRERVAIGFTMGKQLTDSAGLLVRLGTARNSRNVLLKPGGDLPLAPLQSLLLEAYTIAR